VYIKTSSLSVKSGELLVSGTAAGVGANNVGVYVEGSNFTSQGPDGYTSPVTIYGNGSAAGSDNNRGVSFNTSTVTSAAGYIWLTGNGGGTGVNNEGVAVNSSTLTLNGGTGTAGGLGSGIYVWGSGAAGTDANNGVNIAGSTLTASGSDTFSAISVIGTGAGTGTGNNGVVISSSKLTATEGIATAGIFVSGQGGAGTTDNSGVSVSASTLTSNAGSQLVTGIGAGAGTMYGVLFTGGTTLASTAGNICVNGTTPDDTNVAIALQGGTNVLTTAGQIALTAVNGGINLGSSKGGDTANVSSTYSTAGKASISLVSDNGVKQYTGTVGATGGLLLQGEGAFYLESAGNNFTSLAAAIADDTVTKASLILSAQGSFAITSLTGCVECLTLTASGVTVGAAAGSAPPVTPTGNVVVLNVAAGTVTQTTGDTLVTSGLQLRGGADYQLLTNANNVDVITATLTGAGGKLAFNDADSVTVGNFSIAGIQPVPVTYTSSGITTASQNAAIKAVANIYIDKAVNVGTANFGAQAGTLIRQNTTGGITAAGLQLSGGADVNLVAATNDVTTIAASKVGALNYIDTNGFAVGAVATQLSSGATVSGVTATKDVYLTSKATGGSGDIIAINSD
jgi:hypothetical protein